MDLRKDIAACRLCAEEFAQTATHHEPHPIVWFDHSARILIAGQAPGLRVHEAGVPFDDRSGDRLRDWLGVSRDEFYDRSKLAVLPMAFCFPGYDAKGSDLPPPSRCEQTWRKAAMRQLPNVNTTILIGRYAQNWHLGVGVKRLSVTSIVKDWRRYASMVFVIPHPSWRNNASLRRNPWFESELLPEMRARVRACYDCAREAPMPHAPA